MADYGYPPLYVQRCENCRYAVELPERKWDDALRCARHAPVVMARSHVETDGTTWGVFPAVMPSLWCGEWAPGDVNHE
jgi:hypothetical protein